ncbi:reverse transcriptase-like protein [Sphingomonas sp. PB2P12]|uniref:reverse transcriptase-like protein n=1 Tax=Sphingomonas sandaracina TaxID=3096157 RepID=UPI002FC5A5F6
MTRNRRTKVFFDGGCRPNPGKIECAVVLKGITHYRDDVGQGTNSDAEWLAAIYALEIAAQFGEREIVLLGDSTLIVTQATGVAPCRSAELKAHHVRFAALARTFNMVRIRHVGRTQNLAGIALARRHPR